LTDAPEKEEIKNKKKQKVIKHKIPRKMIIESSCDEDFVIPFADSSEDDAIMDEVIKYKRYKDIEGRPITEGSFVLTTLAGKKKISYFVAQVVNNLGGDELEIKYYKRCGDTSKFILEKEDLYVIDIDDIEKKLPAPITAGQSERQVCQISFAIDFNEYHLY